MSYGRRGCALQEIDPEIGLYGVKLMAAEKYWARTWEEVGHWGRTRFSVSDSAESGGGDWNWQNWRKE